MSEKIHMIDRRKERLLAARVTDISWERIIVHMDVEISGELASPESAEGLDFYLVSEFGYSEGRFKVESVTEGASEANPSGVSETDTEAKTGVLNYRISLNVTNPGYCMVLPAGIYTIAVCREEEILCQLTVSLDLAGTLSSHSAMFLHGQRDKGYSVQFALVEDDEELHLEMVAQDMIREETELWNEEDVDPETRLGLVGSGIKAVKNRRRAVITRLYRDKLRKVKRDKNRNEKPTVLFMSEQRETLEANLRSVRDRMVERGLAEDFNILTSTRNIVGKGNYGVKNWAEVMEKIASADVIFVDDHCPMFDWLVLDEKTTLIQLWHAGAGYKSVGYSRWGHKGSPMPFSCHRQYDFTITPGRNIAHFFSEQFGINDAQVVPTGMPRMDEYLDEDHRREVTEKLYETYPQFAGKRIILFAPTYRGSNRKHAHYPMELIDFKGLAEVCGEDAVVLFKMHPFVSDGVPIPREYEDRFLDMSRYPSINDLYYITDLLITDYSSSVFEFSLMRKPMLFFAFDEYQFAYSRGFHRDYRSAIPGKLCHTFEEVLTAIREEDFEFEKNEPYLAYHFDHTDTGARDRVIDYFLLGKMPTEIVNEINRVNWENERIRKLDFTALSADR